MHVFISGSSGLIGSALKISLESDNHLVTALPRTYDRKIDFSDADAVVHLAGENIAEGRWNNAKKKRIEESRVIATKQLSTQLSKTDKQPPIFISASAIGFYGNRNEEKLNEESTAGSGFLADVCKKWEASTLPAEDAGIRTVRIRTGIVLSNTGGALKKMILPFKLGGGGIVGNGRQYMSWISLVDVIQSIRYIIENQSITGPVNLVSPNSVTNHEFTNVLGKVLHRPTFLPLPAFAAKMLFGEMADALLLSSTRVIPDKLIEAGYNFKHTNLKSALEDILK
jgi:uncharacterized protein (TIGR01777 family)